jgi:hypothetical protein
MSVNITNLEKVISSELKLSTNESRTFLLVVKNGKMTEAQRAAGSLVKKGMLIETSLGEYESLHPRFAASNRYRILCEEEHVEFKKNIRIDNIGLALESYYENARTK